MGDEAKNLAVRCVAHQDSRWRAGLQWHREPTTVPVSQLSRDQIDALIADPLLTVMFVAEHDGQEVEIGAKLDREKLDEMLESAKILDEAGQFEAQNFDPANVRTADSGTDNGGDDDKILVADPAPSPQAGDTDVDGAQGGGGTVLVADPAPAPEAAPATAPSKSKKSKT